MEFNINNQIKISAMDQIMKKFGAIFGISVPMLIPFFHLGIIAHLWDEFNYRVDKLNCSCSCWDTVFKGIYERGPGGFKHVYFNTDLATFRIWVSTVIAIILAYEAFKKLGILWYQGKLRTSMACLLCFSVFPHYYSWWSFFNYWNDEFYFQFAHQLFFSVTELISSLVVFRLLDKSIPITGRSALIIMDIAILHVFAAGFDQFIENLFRGSGMLHQILRDVSFMVPDFVHIVVPLLELRKAARKKRLPVFYFISNFDFFASVASIIVGWCICFFL